MSQPPGLHPAGQDPRRPLCHGRLLRCLLSPPAAQGPACLPRTSAAALLSQLTPGTLTAGPLVLWISEPACLPACLGTVLALGSLPLRVSTHTLEHCHMSCLFLEYSYMHCNRYMDSSHYHDGSKFLKNSPTGVPSSIPPPPTASVSSPLSTQRSQVTSCVSSQKLRVKTWRAAPHSWKCLSSFAPCSKHTEL